MENPGRGVVAIRQNQANVYVGRRLLGTAASNISFLDWIIFTYKQRLDTSR